MDEGRRGSNYSGTDIKSRKRGFTLPTVPVTSGTPMPPVNPPKEMENTEKKN